MLNEKQAELSHFLYLFYLFLSFYLMELRLKMLLLQLDKGFIPDQQHLKNTVSYVIDVLCSVSDQADSERSVKKLKSWYYDISPYPSYYITDSIY